MDLLTREEVARRILALPSALQGRAVERAKLLFPHQRGDARKDREARRRYAGNPWAYFRDFFGWTLTQQQEDALQLIEQYDRLLLRGGNNLGKTEWGGGYALYRLDAVASLENPGEHLAERGDLILLPGPDHDTIFATSYGAMLRTARRAEQRGHAMPGERSDHSVLWRVRGEDWRVEAFSPPRSTTDSMSHRASGRHHVNQIALIEEAMGVDEPLWLSVEGMCSAAGNKIICAFNPDRPAGPAFQREKSGAYKSIEWDAFDHPNVTTRTYVIPAAIDYRVIDDAVRTDTRDRGVYPHAEPDATHGDFLYALPPAHAEEHGPRIDGVRGHPDGVVRVYRPSPRFSTQRRGQWPKSTDFGLFDYGAWDESVERWRRAEDPTRIADAVGVDPAREGDDDPTVVPRWGTSGEALLRLYADAEREAAAVAQLRSERRIRLGVVRVLAKGDGVHVAQQVGRLYPQSTWNIDDGGVGSSVLDHGGRVLQMPVVGISFAAVAPEPLHGMPFCENMRTWMYVIFAQLVRVGLVDVPDDPLLREEVLAHEINVTRMRTVEYQDPRRGTIRERKAVVLLIAKDEIKKKIGRSPDRADACVLALVQQQASGGGYFVSPLLM